MATRCTTTVGRSPGFFTTRISTSLDPRATRSFIPQMKVGRAIRNLDAKGGSVILREAHVTCSAAEFEKHVL